jgi:hypothetical protein
LDRTARFGAPWLKQERESGLRLPFCHRNRFAAARLNQCDKAGCEAARRIG